MINTHEKFMEEILEQTISKKELYEMFKRMGYKGTENDVIIDFLGATAVTSTMLCSTRMMNGKVRTEEEYFDILVREMNINY
jgi:hypothetical protein